MTINDFEIVGNIADIDWKTPVETNYAAGMKLLSFKAIAASSNREHAGYEVAIDFLRVEPDEVHNWEALQNKDIKVACHCKQYIFGGCLKGNMHHGCNKTTNAEFTHYERKTDNPNLVRNKEQNPQMCKHLAGLLEIIKESYKGE